MGRKYGEMDQGREEGGREGGREREMVPLLLEGSMYVRTCTCIGTYVRTSLYFVLAVAMAGGSSYGPTKHNKGLCVITATSMHSTTPSFAAAQYVNEIAYPPLLQINQLHARNFHRPQSTLHKKVTSAATKMRV